MINEHEIVTLEDKSQLVSYNNPMFHCFTHERYFPEDSKYRVIDHWHEDIEYLIVKEGAFRCIVNGELIVLHENEGICINSKRIHSNGVIDNQCCHLYCVILNPSYLCTSSYVEEKYVKPMLSAFDYLMLTKNDWTYEILNILSGLFENDISGSSELAIMETAFKILRIMYDNINPSAGDAIGISMYEQMYKTMVTYIGDHYKEKISLGDIALSGNVGKTLCTKIFRKYSSRTPGDYLIHYRITQSMEMLSNTDISITEAAYSCGFTSASHYTDLFRKIVGCTPNQYKKSLEKRLEGDKGW